MKQKTALITGITGQDGSYLAEEEIILANIAVVQMKCC